MVGYLMVIYDDDENTYNLWHVMIDKNHQGKGYGRAGVQAALQYIRQQPFGNSRIVLLTVEPENAAAYHLYTALGFQPTGRADGDEIELSLLL